MSSRVKISISEGNTKMGSVPSVSLTPCTTCAADAPCKRICYARKAYRTYEATRKAYQRNTRMARRNPDEFFTQVRRWLDKKNPDFFRWHVSGDILNEDYLHRMVVTAEIWGGIRFLCFTKRYDIVARYPNEMPSNLSLVLSAWPEYPIHNPKRLPIAWMRPKEGFEDRVSKKALECPGNCESCAMCFHLDSLDKDVVFNQH